MDKYLSSQLFSAAFETGSRTTTSAYVRQTAREAGFNEDWLQGAIAENPQLVLAPCVEAELTDEAWWFWDRELATDAGAIDLVLVSESGRVAIVETKLSYNPEKRRSVLAQVLDYALSLPDVEVGRLPALPAALDISIEDVERRMQLGDFLLIVAGDQLDPRAVRLGRALLGDHMVKPWELALVEVGVFARSGAHGPSHLLVPHLRGAIEADVRNVVRVEVAAGDRNRVVVERRTTTVPPGDVRERWDEQRFFAELKASALPDAHKAFGEGLRMLLVEFNGLVLSWGTGRTGSATLKRGDDGLIEFYLDGSLRFRPRRARLALGEGPGDKYVADVCRMFGKEDGQYVLLLPAERASTARVLPELLQRIRDALTTAIG